MAEMMGTEKLSEPEFESISAIVAMVATRKESIRSTGSSKGSNPESFLKRTVPKPVSRADMIAIVREPCTVFLSRQYWNAFGLRKFSPTIAAAVSAKVRIKIATLNVIWRSHQNMHRKRKAIGK